MFKVKEISNEGLIKSKKSNKDSIGSSYEIMY